MFIHEEEGSDEYILKECYAVPDTKRPSFEEAMKGTYKKIGKGHQFGPSWSTHWVRITLTVPEKFKKYDHVEFHWDSNCEGLVWSEDGEPLQGLTGGGERVEFLFPREWVKDGQKHVFYVEVACNGMFGNGPGDIIQPPDPNRHFRLSKADIVAPNLEAMALNIDFWILGGGSLCPEAYHMLTL
jgi:alpha-mannosidase